MVLQTINGNLSKLINNSTIKSIKEHIHSFNDQTIPIVFSATGGTRNYIEKHKINIKNLESKLLKSLDYKGSIIFKIISPKEEAEFEKKAVQYYKKMVNHNVDCFTSMGSSSSQYGKLNNTNGKSIKVGGTPKPIGKWKETNNTELSKMFKEYEKNMKGCKKILFISTAYWAAKNLVKNHSNNTTFKQKNIELKNNTAKVNRNTIFRHMIRSLLPNQNVKFNRYLSGKGNLINNKNKKKPIPINVALGTFLHYYEKSNNGRLNRYETTLKNYQKYIKTPSRNNGKPSTKLPKLK